MHDMDSVHPATHPFDAMIKAPDHHFVLLENDKVRVLDTLVSPENADPRARMVGCAVRDQLE
jgi:hypothetical protein